MRELQAERDRLFLESILCGLDQQEDDATNSAAVPPVPLLSSPTTGS